VIDEMDAMQYYDDNNDEFKGTGTNATKVLPFEEVKDKAIEKVKARRALEDALLFANESLVAVAQTASMADAAKDYGEVKKATVRLDRPFGFQNARDVIAAAFEMDPVETPFNAIAGTDRVYFVQLENIIPAHVAPLEEVKDRVLADVRRDRLNKALEAKGAALRDKLAAELAKGSAFDAAVAACAETGFTATTGMTFVLNDSAKLEIPYRNEVLGAVGELGVKGLSDAVVTPADEIVLVYVADRQAGDVLAKTTGKAQLAQSLAWPTQFRTAAAWMDWLVDTTPPTADGQVPLLEEDVVDDPEE
ncbi:MAG: peptidyl-prolyl cis-trans isomerase, partial [Kiritimatiellae bacterium]|nr:peptidyl-prolyl cis-trans isomerase [Kiritimatiellia bacterium]